MNYVGLVLTGIDTQVDVHGPGGACPRAEKKEAAKAEEEKPKEEPKKEVIIPVTVEKAQEAQEIHIPITVEKEAEPSKPYAELVEAVAAVRLDEDVVQDGASPAKMARASPSPAQSPSRDSGDWTMVDAKGAAELGARPKSPQKPVEEAPLHPGNFSYCDSIETVF